MNILYQQIKKQCESESISLCGNRTNSTENSTAPCQIQLQSTTWTHNYSQNSFQTSLYPPILHLEIFPKKKQCFVTPIQLKLWVYCWSSNWHGHKSSAMISVQKCILGKHNINSVVTANLCVCMCARVTSSQWDEPQGNPSDKCCIRAVFKIITYGMTSFSLLPNWITRQVRECSLEYLIFFSLRSPIINVRCEIKVQCFYRWPIIISVQLFCYSSGLLEYKVFMRTGLSYQFFWLL